MLLFVIELSSSILYGIGSQFRAFIFIISINCLNEANDADGYQIISILTGVLFYTGRRSPFPGRPGKTIVAYNCYYVFLGGVNQYAGDRGR